jgi:hypothetical protein
MTMIKLTIHHDSLKREATQNTGSDRTSIFDEFQLDRKKQMQTIFYRMSFPFIRADLSCTVFARNQC